MKQGLTQEEIAALFATAEQKSSEPQPATFPGLNPDGSAEVDPASLGQLADVELELTVELGQSRRNIREILAMGEGAVMELDRHAGDLVDILVNGRLVARGEVVVIGESYGVRIAELVSPEGGKEK